MPRYDIVARVDNELYWSSYLYCGLYELASRGVVRLRFSLRSALSPVERLCTLLQVTRNDSGARRVIAIDWRDNPDILAPRKLARCDVYFKRNYIPGITERVCPPELRDKLRPAGLSFAMRGERERPIWVQLLGSLWHLEQPIIHRSARRTARRLFDELVRQPQMVSGLRRRRQFERDGLREASEIVLFQTRAYDPRVGSRGEDTAAVTQQRAEVIRALKRELGERFIGGFIPTAYAAEAYPDCLATAPTSLGEYADLVHRCSICVYTRGLRDSPAFKLGEYLAAARCILAEEPRTRLPQPLRDGQEVLLFQDVDGLLSQCRRVLTNQPLQHELSSAAHSYYEAEVRPEARVLQMFSEAFEALG